MPETSGAGGSREAVIKEGGVAGGGGVVRGVVRPDAERRGIGALKAEEE